MGVFRMGEQNPKQISTTSATEMFKQSFTQIAFNELVNIVTSMYKWKNLPDSIEEDRIEQTLLYNGTIGFFKNNDTGKLLASGGTGQGFNFYGLPTEYQIVNPVYDKLYTNTTFTIGKDLVMVRANDAYGGTYGNSLTGGNAMIGNPDTLLGIGFQSNIMTLQYFAQQLGNIRYIQNNNMQALNQPYIFNTTQENEESMKVLANKIMHGEQALFLATKKGYKDEQHSVTEDVQLLNLNPQYYVDKLEDQYNNIRNEALTYFGINNFNTDKKERSLVGEVNSNNSQIKLGRERSLRLRQEGAKEINKLFGTNITVEYAYEEEEEHYNEPIHSDVRGTVRDNREDEE